MEQDTSDSGPPIPASEHHANKIDGMAPDEIPTRWYLWVQEIAGGAKQQDIAARIGIDQSHISRWKAGYRPGIDFVTKTAEAYGRNKLEALVAAEILTEEEAGIKEVRVSDPDELTDEEVLEQIRKRFGRSGGG